MNSISNFIGNKLGLCLLPSRAPTVPPPRDKEDSLNQRIAHFLDYQTSIDSDDFWDNTLSNDRTFYILTRHCEWDLAEKFYTANPDVDLYHEEDSRCSHSLSNMMEAIKGKIKGNPWYSEKGDVYKLLLLILENDSTVDLFKEMATPHERVLDFLVHTTQIKLVHKFIENLMSSSGDKEKEEAKKIFIAITEILENKKNPPLNQDDSIISMAVATLTDFYEKDLSCWDLYLSLIKEAHPEVFSEIDHENPIVDLAAKAINTLVNRLWLPAEVYEKIACETVLQGQPADLRKLLHPKFQLEPQVSKETLIKLTTLSFLAFQENSKVKLDTRQKKQCFRLINKAIFKHGSIFNAEIKERIVREIGQMDHFSKLNIKKALEKAFN